MLATRAEQRRIALEDPLLQLDQRLARLQPELGGEQPARPLIGLERIRLAPRAVQSQHQLTPQPLLERMLGDEPLELCHQLARRAGLEVGVEPQQDRLQALLLQRPAPLRDAPLGGHVAQRLAAEQPQRLAQQRSGLLRARALACSTSSSNRHTSSSKPPGLQRIPGRLQHQQRRRAGPRSLERWTCSADTALAGGCSPHSSSISRSRESGTPAAEHQQRQQRALAPAGQRHGLSVPLEHERAEHPETTNALGHPPTD